MTKYDKQELLTLLAEGASLHIIGMKYGVSRQRMYQVLSSLDIPTSSRTRKRMYLNDPKMQWLNRMLSYKKVPRQLRQEFLEEIDLPDTCPVLGSPLDYTANKGTRSDNSPSIDQVIAGGGYSLDNILVISWRANRIKNDSTVAELKKITDFYSNLLNNA
tara:strand:- start:12 stop:491 length:480 start_codon:yes stop_codon:yes gene_type:complete